MPQPKWLVLGLGNPLVGADALGPAVVDRLRLQLPPFEDVALIDAHTDLLGYLHQFAQSDHVVLIDAVVDEEATGLQIVDEAEFRQWDETVHSVHRYSPLAAVKLFRTLYPDARTRIILVAFRVKQSEFGNPPTAAAIQTVSETVERLLRGPELSEAAERG